MEVQIATLCDSASDYRGKLCILGSFDTICGKSLPVVHPHCAIALRFCCLPEDVGLRQLRVALIDADGQPIIPPLDIPFEVKLPPNTFFMTRNLVMNFQQLQFKTEGQFAIDITSDGGALMQIPLRVVLLKPPTQSEG